MAFEGSENLLKRSRNFVADHLQAYLATGGRVGHIVDVSHTGSEQHVGTLLLQNFGRKSGREYITPLIYGCYAKEWIVIASKAGATEHPAWYLNLGARCEVRFQVATQCFEGSWRKLAGDERAEVWTYMARLFTPYNDYQQAAGERVIPVIAMKPNKEIPVLTPGNR